ncbi:MAG: SUF system NifU family Fe-S cluster assembly protein [Acidobacteria bacterium]|nr:MAG: SUF system NifU family Fe-S cluster assembly protein [Acidobacteriota bacterium]REJ99550.1 MAG: SUF system NifU family Fe-S cluster assembly protein [Acidobacteriota bacterium]
MDDLRALYQEVILDHYKRPRHFGALEEANRRAEGTNPLCGDQITVYAKVEDGVIRDVSFEGMGCAISTASASLMTEALSGKTLEEAARMHSVFHRLLTAGDEVPDIEGLGKLEVLAGVRDFPVRIKCATLAWHALRAALEQSDEPVTTE